MKNIGQAIRLVLGVIQLRGFDRSTSEGRSRERYRRIALTSIAAILARASGVAVGLVSVPMAVGYLGAERYGMWMTATSILTFLTFADLGIGNGLLNSIAEADGLGNEQAKLVSISSATVVLCAIAMAIVFSLLAAYPFIPWSRIYNVSTNLAAAESGPASMVLVSSVALNMPLGVVQNVQMGHQEGVKCHAWNIGGAVLSLLGLALAVKLRAGLPYLVLGMTGGPVIARLLNWIVEFGFLNRSLLPRWHAFSWASGRSIMGAGVLFLVLQLCAIVGTTSDSLVIAQVMGSSAVAAFAITQRLFSVSQLAQYFIAPLWPAIGEAIARGESAWARRTLNRALVISLVLAVATSIPLVVFGKTIIRAWVGDDLVPSTAILVGFGVWALLASYSGTMATVLNNPKFLARQVVYYAAASIASLALKIVLVPYWQGAGAIWATVAGYGILFAGPAAVIAYGALSERSSEPAAS